MKDAKDPDEYLKRFGADKFRLLLESSSNRVEYQLNAIRRKFDLREDDQKIQYVHESAELICTLDSSVKREVYGARVAEAAGISLEAMKLEVNKAFKRRINREKKKQEQIDLAPAKNLQPKSRNFRYDNMKSAMAEETVIAMALKEPAMLNGIGTLKAEQFSSNLLGKVFDQLCARYRQGLEVSISVLADLDGEEMSHIVSVVQRHQGPVNEDALNDCVRIIQKEYQSGQVDTVDELMAYRNRLKESKGVKA